MDVQLLRDQENHLQVKALRLTIFPDVAHRLKRIAHGRLYRAAAPRPILLGHGLGRLIAPGPFFPEGLLRLLRDGLVRRLPHVTERISFGKRKTKHPVIQTLREERQSAVAAVHRQRPYRVV